MLIHTILIILVFFVFAGLMVSKKLPTIIALPFMAVCISFAAGMPLNNMFNLVIKQGALKLSDPIIATIFGGLFARIISKAGIAENIIKTTAELIGDKPYLMAFGLSIAVAVIFSTIGGMGAVIMTGSIVLPLMISVGIRPLTAGGLMLMGMNLGGMFNLAGLTFYEKVLGVPIVEIKSYVLMLSLIALFILIVFTLVNVRQSRIAWSMPKVPGLHRKKELSIFAIISPLVPIVIAFAFNVNVIAALLIGCIYTVLVTDPKKSIRIFTSSMIEGVHDVAGVIFLMVGIGMLVNSVTAPSTTQYLHSIIQNTLPSGPVGYIVFFTVLSPLALYRGPLNMWGLGSGLANLMIVSKKLPAFMIMAALMSVGCIQGICDPTNSQNVWIADYLKEDTVGILKKTLLYVIALTFIALVCTVLIYWK